ncbi:MAG: c-type cytochrome [Akkermansiaceae bacterium]|nr:c-type cytochrome [Akkermansiaceae bacterium]
MKRSLFLCFVTPLTALAAPPAAPPKAPDVPAELPAKIELLQPGVTLTLLAEHPDLVTPTGIDVDEQGNIWLAACHTHFRPEGYQGPEHDEILVFDKNGKSRRVFYNETDATMHVEIGPDGWIYLSERDRILRVKDTDGDGKADVSEDLAVLETEADYPHNGLSGMAWHPDGHLVFSLGENFFKDWTLTGKDGRTVKGRGEGGVFVCTADGRELRRIARGFWNPFGLLVRPDGEMFAAENDPGSSPPCRLLNIIEGADYGYQRAYGGAAYHPFVAWNGELRGTLGMVHRSGEGPCAIVQLGGGVMIPSWSEHRIDYYPLHRQGAGYTSEQIPLLRGSDFFRPVCMAPGPDGAFYLTDWVFSSYPIHGRGRLWKLEIDPDAAKWIQKEPEPMNEAATLAKELRSGNSAATDSQLFEDAKGGDPYLSDAALTALARRGQSWTPESLRDLSDGDRVWALVALRRVDLYDPKWVRALASDPNPEIQFERLRWISDAVLTEFSGEVEKKLADPALDFRLFEASLAAWNTLRGNPDAGVSHPEVLVERLTNPAVPDKLKGFALRLVDPAQKRVTDAMLSQFLDSADPGLALEAARTLAARNQDGARDLLAKVAADSSRPDELRAEAIVGLAVSTDPAHQSLLVTLAGEAAPVIRDESLRALRLTSLNNTQTETLKAIAKAHPESAALVAAVTDLTSLNAGRPGLDDTAGWQKRLDAISSEADPEAGRRLFFHTKIALCSTCHRHNGRGNVVGPDLSLVGRQGGREALLQSILEPHREVAPQFYPTQLKLADGTGFIGILLRSSSVDVFRDITGKERSFKPEEIVERTELKTSLMPPGLPTMLTDRELRDLLAFLASSGSRP